MINDLSFNLCIVLWSPVMRSVTYFRMRISRQSRGPRDIELGPNDVNLQTEELHYNYLVLIGSPE